MPDTYFNYVWLMLYVTTQVVHYEEEHSVRKQCIIHCITNIALVYKRVCNHVDEAYTLVVQPYYSKWPIVIIRNISTCLTSTSIICRMQPVPWMRDVHAIIQWRHLQAWHKHAEHIIIGEDWSILENEITRMWCQPIIQSIQCHVHMGNIRWYALPGFASPEFAFMFMKIVCVCLRDFSIPRMRKHKPK